VGGDEFLNVNNRIKLLRKDYLKLTQEQFSDAISISRANLGSIEVERINVTDRVVQDICREFNVSEVWLRNGEGEVFISFPIEDEFFRAAAELSKEGDEFIIAGVVEYWKLDKDSRSILKNYLLHIADRIKKEEQS
jgi:DNA-binding XRE family transcriptional regulator